MRKRESSFVSSAGPSWLTRLWAILFPPRVRRPSIDPIQAATIYVTEPPHVWLLRQRGKEARQLLARHIDGWPTSRRAWVAAGHKEGAWRRGRAILLKAKLIDADGDLVYTPRDSRRRLETYLDAVEQQCRMRNRFVAPW